jgi:hypothetical protein
LAALTNVVEFKPALDFIFAIILQDYTHIWGVQFEYSLWRLDGFTWMSGTVRYCITFGFGDQERLAAQGAVYLSQECAPLIPALAQLRVFDRFGYCAFPASPM